MKKVFNLKKHTKKAFYDGDRGYWNKQTRSWMNCYKCKSNEGIAPQKAWDDCLAEYQDSTNKAAWALNYTSVVADGPQPYFDAKTPAAQKITK